MASPIPHDTRSRLAQTHVLRLIQRISFRLPARQRPVGQADEEDGQDAEDDDQRQFEGGHGGGAVEQVARRAVQRPALPCLYPAQGIQMLQRAVELGDGYAGISSGTHLVIGMQPLLEQLPLLLLFLCEIGRLIAADQLRDDPVVLRQPLLQRGIVRLGLRQQPVLVQMVAEPEDIGSRDQPVFINGGDGLAEVDKIPSAGHIIQQQQQHNDDQGDCGLELMLHLK